MAFPDRVFAGIGVAHLGRSSVRYEVGIFAGEDVAASAQGHFVHVYVHRDTGRPVTSLQALEQEVGAQFFDRTSRPPRLTAAGQQMVEAARELVRAAENAIDSVSGRRVIGTLAIGSVRTSAMSLLPRAIVRFQGRFP